MDKVLEKIYNAIVAGNSDESISGVQTAINGGLDAEIILKEGLISAMDEVGKLFENGDYFVPEMLIAARAMQRALDLLRPLLVEKGLEPAGKMVIGTTRGDLHDIGKNLVAMMIEGAGFEVIDLGTNVSSEQFVDAVKEYAPDLVGLSALLTTTMTSMKNTVDALIDAGLRENVRIIIGGAPITTKFSEDIGADGYASDAGQAVSLVNKWAQDF